MPHRPKTKITHYHYLTAHPNAFFDSSKNRRKVSRLSTFAFLLFSLLGSIGLSISYFSDVVAISSSGQIGTLSHEIQTPVSSTCNFSFNLTNTGNNAASVSYSQPTLSWKSLDNTNPHIIDPNDIFTVTQTSGINTSFTLSSSSSFSPRNYTSDPASQFFSYIIKFNPSPSYINKDLSIYLNEPLTISVNSTAYLYTLSSLQPLGWSSTATDSYGYSSYELTSCLPIPSYNVTFDSADGTLVPSQSIPHGSTATKPTDPTRIGYDFLNWTLDGNPYNFTTPVTDTINLVAQWQPSSFIITWLNYDSTVFHQESSIDHNNKMPSHPTSHPNKPSTPQHDYPFESWVCSPPVTTGQPVTENIVCAPQFNETDRLYTITWQSYSTDGATLTTTITTSVQYDTQILLLAPTPVAYTINTNTYAFTNWSCTPNDTTVTSDITCTANYVSAIDNTKLNPDSNSIINSVSITNNNINIQTDKRNWVNTNLPANSAKIYYYLSTSPTFPTALPICTDFLTCWTFGAEQSGNNGDNEYTININDVPSGAYYLFVMVQGGSYDNNYTAWSGNPITIPPTPFTAPPTTPLIDDPSPLDTINQESASTSTGPSPSPSESSILPSAPTPPENDSLSQPTDPNDTGSAAAHSITTPTTPLQQPSTTHNSSLL